VDTGKRRGISTQIVGEAAISSDGSFSALVPANVPMQFQLIDTSGRVLVNHKPWIHVAPGATERCVGCHAPHNQNPTVQTLEARQLPSQNVEARRVTQFHFHQDIQPILDQKCIACHDSANVHGAAGYNPNRAGSKGISLVGRFTPANVTESYQTLTGASRDMGMNAYTRTQNARRSPLMHWLTGVQLDATPPTAFPNPPALVDHSRMLNEEELDKIARWIDTGTNFRVVTDNVPNALQQLDVSTFTARIWPIMQARGCVVCHDSSGTVRGIGQDAMDLSIGDAETEDEAVENRILAMAAQMNFMIPEASPLLRKPLGEALGGLSHVGGQIWAGVDDPDYLAIYQWIVASNPRLNPAAAPNVSDLVNVENYPNPFRDTTTFVYRLNGSVATKVDLSIYSVNGKVIRELSGTTTIGGASMGWNTITWDGKDKNGKVVSNDVYFFILKAEFGDGAKKKFRGKCVKVN
jgi:mono/diheme cytochrome c family protein